ncbi:ELM2 domain-containing protein [Ditylenchus destructor]|uniref:ELM2 domain-containing protein n=1 Tax=Ditylenchus destructor TaxID=166010 RepID=A0AAD4RCY9_9BILA|nr:ELM2 domain-containing protein [Ditylenchus destructor]
MRRGKKRSASQVAQLFPKPLQALNGRIRIGDEFQAVIPDINNTDSTQRTSDRDEYFWRPSTAISPDSLDKYCKQSAKISHAEPISGDCTPRTIEEEEALLVLFLAKHDIEVAQSCIEKLRHTKLRYLNEDIHLLTVRDLRRALANKEDVTHNLDRSAKKDKLQEKLAKYLQQNFQQAGSDHIEYIKRLVAECDSEIKNRQRETRLLENLKCVQSSKADYCGQFSEGIVLPNLAIISDGVNENVSASAVDITNECATAGHKKRKRNDEIVIDSEARGQDEDDLIIVNDETFDKDVKIWWEEVATRKWADGRLVECVEVRIMTSKT